VTEVAGVPIDRVDVACAVMVPAVVELKVIVPDRSRSCSAGLGAKPVGCERRRSRR
jgi:hypothetical protein